MKEKNPSVHSDSIPQDSHAIHKAMWYSTWDSASIGEVTGGTYATTPESMLLLPGTLKGTNGFWLRIKGYKMENILSKLKITKRDMTHLIG
jgi:hypothetical protein